MINLKYQLQHGTKSSNFLMAHIMYQIFKTILSLLSKKHETVTDNPSIIINVNKKDDIITFKIKTRYYLELLTPETIKLFKSTKSKTTKDKNSENVPHLKITEVVLIQRNIVNNNYQ